MQNIGGALPCKEYWSLFVVEEDEMFRFNNLPGLHTKKTLAMHMRRNEANHVVAARMGSK